jgi:uncharacterized protein (DUF362 family)
VEADLRPKIRGRVLIKPNFVCTSRKPAATHVDAVRAVLDFVVQANPKEIVVAEGAGPGNTAQGWHNFGYDKLPDEYPVRLVDLNGLGDWQTIRLLDGRQNLVEARINTFAVEADCRISVAIPKTHDTSICTLSLKNMMGALALTDRGKMHGRSDRIPSPQLLDSARVMGRNIVRLNRKLLPHIAVLDGFEGMEGNGPCDGDPVPLRAAVASADPVAADAVGAKLMGFEPQDVGFIFYANAAGMGVGDLARIEVLGDEIAKLARKFKPHPYYITHQHWRIDPPWLLD